MSQNTTSTDEDIKIEVLDVNQTNALRTIISSEIDVQIATAKAYPRSIKKFMDKALSMATVSEDVAAMCTYALPRGGKSIEGPSVRLAEIVCAAYTNIRAGARIIFTDEKFITAQGFCHDLENNNFVAVEVKRRITDKNGKTFNDDMIGVTGNAACAIAYRNAVFKVIPAALIQDIYERVQEIAKGNAETLVARRNKALDYFRKLGKKDEEICAVLEIQAVEDIDIDKLHILSGMKSAIKNSESTLEELFAPKVKTGSEKGTDATNATVDALKKRADDKKK